MPIVITTAEGSEVFETREDIKQVQAKTEEVSKPVKEEKANTESNSEEVKEEKEVDPFAYLDEKDEFEEDDEDSEEDIEDDEEEEDDAKPVKKSGFKKRIDKLNNRNTELMNRIAQLEAKVAPAAAKQEEVIKVEELKEPDIAEYEDYGDYIKALSKYTVNEERKAAKIQQEAEIIKAESEKVLKKWEERVEDAKKRYGKDKFDAIKTSNLPMTGTIRMELLDSEVGPDMLYFLAKNPEELTKICQLSPVQQVRELTKLEIRVKNKLGNTKVGKEEVEQNKVSKAPPPIRPITSKVSSSSVKKPEDMTNAEYRAYRDKQKNAGKK